MRETASPSPARRLMKAVAAVAEAIAREAGRLLEGAGPAPQPVPVRVRSGRSR
ncbi:hypothetical protein [Methylobacterium iners]|uniref:Uncharacterized protein n=1 Tax=Methylobacterium iners TaxID=418707 RepID=A0ABQ4RY66_9HYPH|nr:hypothetical protein [Methylobacterium iners]GJD94578.1 hypothetical protein OCOJLMKI_1781 [Methylobacterium iners]